MLKIIAKVLLAILLLIALGVGGVYLYLKFSPKKSITIPADSKIAQEIIKQSIPDITSCNTDTDCSWYEENAGKPPGDPGKDRIFNYCRNETIMRQCPHCNKLDQTQDSSLASCKCIARKCTPSAF